MIKAHLHTYIDSPAPEEFHSSDPDYEPETESEEEEEIESEEEEEIESEEEMDKLRLVDPALADRVTKSISTNWLDRVDQHVMNPL
jgi:hypothetical protein